MLDLFFCYSLLVVNELFVLHSYSCTHGHNCYLAVEKTNKGNNYCFICHYEKMWLPNLMAIPFSSVSYRGDVAWTRMEVSRMRTEGAKDKRIGGWTDGAEDGQSQRLKGVGDVKSHDRT